MPIYEYLCQNCDFIIDSFASSYRKKKKTIDCPVCTSKMKPIMSRFATSPGMMKKLSGVDDTDDLTLGKLVANKGLPAEYKRKLTGRINKFNKGKEKFKKRQRQYKFEENARTD